MTVVDALGAFRLQAGIDAEQYLHGFTPIHAISDGIEQTHINFHMFQIVVSELITCGGNVFERFNHSLAQYLTSERTDA